MANKKYWAIAIGQWVEVRVALHPPQKVETQAIKTYETVESYWDNRAHGGAGDYRTRKARKQFTIKAVIYKGGKAIFTLKRDRFRAAVGKAIDNGGMLALSSAEADKVIAYAREIGKSV